MNDRIIVADRIARGESLEDIFPEWSAKYEGRSDREESVIKTKKHFQFREVSASTLQPMLAHKFLVQIGLVQSNKEGQRVIEQGGFIIKAPEVEDYVIRSWKQEIFPAIGYVYKVGPHKVLVTE